MRLSVDHRTTYRFSAAQARLTQLLRLTPSGTDGQTVAEWRIHVDCDAKMRHGRDGFGNRTTMLYVEGPVTSIEIEVIGEVLTSGSDGILHGSIEPLPPALYLRPSPLTPADPVIAAFAREAVAGVDDPIAQFHALNRALHHRFAYDRTAPVSGRTASEAFVKDKATPRDMAQMFASAARSIGAPARYVSGYCLFAGGETHLPAPHGWVEAHVERLGWVAFDPCAGLSADQGYVRVAVGLDSAGAAPIAGSRLGDGGETLDVDVVVDEVSEQ